MRRMQDYSGRFIGSCARLGAKECCLNSGSRNLPLIGRQYTDRLVRRQA